MGTFPICNVVCHIVPRSAPPGGGPTIPLTPWGSPRILGILGANPEPPGLVPAGRMRGRTRDAAQSLRIDTVVLSEQCRKYRL